MDIPAGAIIASRYRVVRELGRGGMGAVYLAEHTNTGDHVALKVLLGAGAVDYETLERFKREARAPAKIKSENVVKVLDADTAPELGGAPFLVMELLDGTDLQKVVRQRGRVGADLVVEWLGQAARALDKSHALGIVHRDLKPENVFLHRREDGSTIVKVLDFGISKVLPQAHASIAPMTQLGSVMGTPLFMAPEQARGAVHQIGPATDVWAIGLVALHLLTGEHYWGSPRTLADLMTLIIRCELYPPTSRWPFLPPLFDAWFARSCAREPAQRFATVGEQIAALATAFGIRPVASGPQPGGPTVTDAFGATAAAPSGGPPMTPHPGTPPTAAMTPHGVPATMPFVGASTTGAVSHDPAWNPPAQPSGPSAGRLLLVGGALFALVVGVGAVVIVALLPAGAKGPANTQPTLAAPPPPVDLGVPGDPTTTSDLPSLTKPAAPTWTPPPSHDKPRPSASAVAAPPSASARVGNTNNANNTNNTYQACMQRCAAECRPDSDPVGCAQQCTLDRCSGL